MVVLSVRFKLFFHNFMKNVDNSCAMLKVLEGLICTGLCDYITLIHLFLFHTSFSVWGLLS